MVSDRDFPTVGVVGGGQLARMMVPPSVELGVRLRVLSPGAEDPAAAVAAHVIGDPDDLAALRQLAAGVDVITFDHELVPGRHLADLEAAGAVLRPGAAALAHAQDKLVMRRRLAGLDVAMPAWAQVLDRDEIVTFGDALGWPVVAKRARGGYDGRGVTLVAREEALAGSDVLDGWFGEGVDVLVEEKVAFRRELAVLLARSPSNQVCVWPVVQTLQVDGMCREVLAPAPDLDDETAAAAALAATRIAAELGVVGVMAVEGFEPDEAAVARGAPRFIVNELAMRPHNSGHWTIDGCVTSQFENHLRAVLDLPLGDVTAHAPATAMVNIVGAAPPDFQADLYSAYLHVMARDPGARVHVYGKAVRPGRKVGHVTVSAATHAEALERARHAAGFIAGTVHE